jgi:hypothetical protein
MFDFTIEPKITKEFLLSKNNEETYMTYYLGIPVQKGLFKSPLRSDNHVTCSFFKGKSGTLYFKDFANGECLNFESVVMKKFNCNYHEALKIIAKDFGYINSPVIKKQAIKIQPKFEGDKQTFIQSELKEFSEAELKWWGSFGITKDILNKFKVYSCKTVFLNGSVYAQSAQHSPIYGYYFGKKENVEQWRIYMPKRKEFRFIGNVSSKTIQGYKQLPKSGKVLVITKSMKDVMTLYSFGIPAIAPNSETQFISEKVYDELKQRFKHIILLYDNDLTGVRFSNKIRKKFLDLKVSIIPRSTGAKDISDYYHMYGKEKTLDFIKDGIKYLKSKYEEIG